MSTNLMALLLSAGAVTIAEMGDKTQLLAMAFAAKYSALKVMIGVFIATVLNHALAVAVGNLITRFEAIDTWIQSIAALSFVFFGLWTIRGDKLDGEENKSTKYGAVATVTIAFFIAELGDKTQLTTIALASQYPMSPLWVLAGTTLGMLIADSIGICAGVVINRIIPESTVKLISAGVFILFGFVKIYSVAVGKLGLTVYGAAGILFVLAVLTAAAAYIIIRSNYISNETEAVGE